ncbi:MAG: extracellular solute-binding protein [Candidatus Pacebacteria bacterium]|nr:extracellular solute-binding protein [Candidatus Paceibacterota bacterium]
MRKNTEKRKPGRPREPVSEKLYQALKRAIVEHAFEDDGKFPPELELCERFGVSRSTLRRVLKRIEEEGLLSRRPGDGSYVTKEGGRGITEVRKTAVSGAPSTAAGDAQECLKLGSFEYPDVNRSFWRTAFEGFSAEYSGVELRGRRTQNNETADSSDASSMPDAFNVNAADLQVLASRGLLLDLTPLEGELDEWPAFRPGVLDACRVDGRLHALPQEINVATMYCNGSLLEKAGLAVDDATWDWEVLLDLVKTAIPILGGGVYGMNFLAAYTYMLYFGVFRCDRAYAAARYRATDHARRMLEWFREVLSIERAMFHKGGDDHMELRKFLAGEMLFYFHGTSMNPYLQRFCHFPILNFRPPREEGALGHKIVVTWALNAETILPLAGWEWLKYVSGSDLQRRLAANGGNISAREISAKECPLGDTRLSAELSASAFDRLPSRLHRIFEGEVWGPAFNALLSGEASASSALQMMEDRHRGIEALFPRSL